MKPKEGRKHVVLLEEPVCTREVFGKAPLAPGSVKVRLDFTTYKAKESMRKCPSSTRNQERIFIAGDTVSIPNIYRGCLQDLDSTTPLWFLVQKARTRSSIGSNTNATKGTKAQLWKRCWGELARFLEHSTAEKVTKSFEASEVGMVKPSPKRVNSAREALVSPSLSALLITCYLVNLCPTGRCESASELWIQREFFTEYEGKCENNDGNNNNADNVSGNDINGNSNGGDKQSAVSCHCDNQQRNETFYNNNNNKMVYRKKKTHVVRSETEHIKTVIVQPNTLPSIEASPLIYSSSATQNNITNSIKTVINSNNVNANTNSGNDANSTELSQQSLPSFAPQQSPPEMVSYLPPPPPPLPPPQHVLTQAMTMDNPSQSLTVPPNLYYSHPHNNNSNNTFNNNSIFDNNNNIFDNNNNIFNNNSFNNCSTDDRNCFGIGQRSDDDDDGSGFPDYFDSFDQNSFAENHFYGMDCMPSDSTSSYSSSESESSDLSSTFSSVPAAVDINPSSYFYESAYEPSLCDCCCGSGCVNDDNCGDGTFHFCDAYHLNC